MRSWIDDLFGVDLSGWSTEDHWYVEFISVGDGDFWFWAAVGLAAVALAVNALYKRDGEDLRPALLRTLAAMRVAVIAILVVMLLEPVLVLERSEDVPSNLVLLVDASESMTIADPFPSSPANDELARTLGLADPGRLSQLSRSELVAAILTSGLADDLAAGGDRVVHQHAFSDRFRMDELLAEVPSTSVVDAGARTYTAIGTAIEQALAAYQGRPLAGILLVSDGQSNAGTAPVAAAELARAAGVRIQVLAAGSAAEARNAAILRLEHDTIALVRDPLEVVVHLEARGLEGQELRVGLELRRADGPWELGMEEGVLLGEGQRLARVSFRLQEDEPGDVELRARVSEFPGETTLDDNVAVGTVRVIRQEMRVLLVARQAFPEVQFLINALMRDPAYRVASWLQFADPNYEQKGNERIRALPRTLEDLSTYDCVVLYDPDLDELPVGFASMLSDFVGKDAGGLVYVAGEGPTEKLFDRQFVEGDALLGILPVLREPGIFRSRIERRAIASKPWKMVLTEAGHRSELFQFTDDSAENERILSSLPGMYWHFPVTKGKPGATVLARHGDPRMQNRFGAHVVIASQFYGPGRCTFLALDSTYRWRYLGEELFDGFWARLIGRAGRASLLGSREPLFVSSDQARYHPGSVVTLNARFRDEPGARDAPRSLLGELEVGDSEPHEVVLLPSSDDPTIYEAQLRAEQSGEYVLRVWPSVASQEGATPTSHRFLVELANRELATPWQEHATLAAVASAAGGRVFDMTEFEGLSDAFATRRVSLTDQDRQELWDAPLFSALIFLLLFLEWVLRKRYRLV